MVKKNQQSARETKREAEDRSKANIKHGLFASCSFSSLGLDHKLSDQLQGSLFLFLAICAYTYFTYVY